MTIRDRLGLWPLIMLTVTVISPQPSAGIPVFARIYNQPCGACHTVYPQLNPAGEAFRAHGLHSLPPAVEPIRIGSFFHVPGTLPLALALGVGDDISKVSVPGKPEDLQEHANLEFLSIMAGGELGEHLAFLADYTPLRADTRTGELVENTRVGLGFLQAHAAQWGWLFNFRGGLYELPLGTSPRVHRLSVQSYLTYGLTAFSLLGRKPPVTTLRTDTLMLSATQIGGELTAAQPNGATVALGVTNGSNNRKDNNSSKDVYLRLAHAFGFRDVGMLIYYSPDVLGLGTSDWALRIGPDFRWYSRRLLLTGQMLSGYDSNPTDRSQGFWYHAGFLEADFRITPTVVTLARAEYVGTPTFDDTERGGTTRIKRRIFQVTGGLQWLLRENLKLVAEGTYGENGESVSGRTTESYSVTVREPPSGP